MESQAYAERRIVRREEPGPRGAATNVVAEDPLDALQEGTAPVTLRAQDVLRRGRAVRTRTHVVRIVLVPERQHGARVVASRGARRSLPLPGHQLGPLVGPHAVVLPAAHHGVLALAGHLQDGGRPEDPRHASKVLKPHPQSLEAGEDAQRHEAVLSGAYVAAQVGIVWQVAGAKPKLKALQHRPVQCRLPVHGLEGLLRRSLQLARGRINPLDVDSCAPDTARCHQGHDR
mmetsp:Transcript_57445/g.158989  ORF Transcript_57445/g.158989 Transcript_57445/m.158989 type:complete len:231 (-) Transcript_57445:1580-2272(-)